MHVLASELTGLEEVEVAVDLGGREFVELELKAGEFSLHHVGIVHGSEPNNSNRRRIGFAVRYMAPHVRQTIAVTDGAMLVRGRTMMSTRRFWPRPSAESLGATGWNSANPAAERR